MVLVFLAFTIYLLKLMLNFYNIIISSIATQAKFSNPILNF